MVNDNPTVQDINDLVTINQSIDVILGSDIDNLTSSMIIQATVQLQLKEI